MRLLRGPSKEERQKSIGEGFSLTWDVSKDYEVVDGVLRPKDDWAAGYLYMNAIPFERRYMPGAYPQLVAEIAKLNVNDPDGLVSFAKNWGLLGFSWQVMEASGAPIKDRVEYLKSLGAEIGDPLPWIDAHIHGVNVCLKLLEYLKHENYEGIKAYILSFRSNDSWVEEGHEPSANVSIQYGKHHAIGFSRFEVPNREASHPPYSEPEQYYMHAKNIIEGIINDNLKGGISPALQHDWQTGFIEVFEFTSLMDVIYWHLKRLAVSEMGLEKCRECGQYFVQTHGRQQFCPPDGWERNKAESRCARRYRARKAKKGTKPGD